MCVNRVLCLYDANSTIYEINKIKEDNNKYILTTKYIIITIDTFQTA